MTAVRVTVYGRPGCHLCDEAVESLGAISASFGGIEIVQVDIESDDRLLSRFLEKIPVIELDETVISELDSEPAVLRQRLNAAGLMEPDRDGYADV